jgi:hypothetical protein
LTSSADGTNLYLHASFKLAKSGGSIALFDRQTNLVDKVTYGPQINGISQGRYPDGSAMIYFMHQPSPGAPNQFSNSPPTLASIPNRTVAGGATVSFAAIAVDPDSPPQKLTFTLDPTAPAGAAIDPASGIFTWTVPTVQSPATNAVIIRVTDDGTPPLSDAKSFLVIDNPVQAAAIQIIDIQANASQVSLTWTSQAGQTYRLQFKNSLTATNWTDIPGDISAAGASSSASDGIGSTNSARYYRVVGLQ